MIVFRILRFFLWVGVLAVVLVLWFGAGSPHVIWDYRFQTDASQYDPFADRYYTECTYVGWGFSHVTEPARNGRCGWVRWVKAEATR